MKVTVEFPAEEVSRFAQLVFNDQMPFATSLALNNTAKAFQKDQRAHMASTFKIRRPSFAKSSVKIKPFASKTSPEVKIAIDSPGSTGRHPSDIFAKFEDQTSKSPTGGRFVAIPTEHVPRTASGVIKKRWRPKALRDKNFRENFRVFRRKSRSGFTIFFDERAHGGKIIPLYQLVPSVKIRPELDFIENATRTVNREWVDQFSAAFDRATRTARR